MTTISLSRASYLARRLRETPTSFLVRKLLLEVRKRTYRAAYSCRRVTDLAASRARLSAGYFQLGRAIRERWLQHAREEPEQARRSSVEAVELLSRGWPCLGYGRVSIPRGEAWHSDAVHGITWPRSYFANVDFVREDAYCDVKIPWELSRLQYLVWFSEASLTASECDIRERCRAALNDILRDWMTWNPPGFGINWVSAMEVAIRAINILLATAPVFDELDNDVKSLVARQLAHHRNYLARFPEVSDVNGNHHLAGLLGEQYLVFALASKRADAVACASAAVARELDVQFEEEGAHHERSIGYHRLCQEFAVYSAALQVRCNDVLGPPISGVLTRAFAFTRVFSLESYYHPIIGDADGGSVVNYQQHPRDVSWFDALTGSQPELQVSQARVVRLLEAVAGCRNFLEGAVPGATEKRTSARPSGICRSGFVALRGHGWEVFSRAGSHGLAGRAPHDHDDNAAVWVGYCGQDVLVERGCHSYTLSRGLRSAALASSSHNVVCVEGTERYRSAHGSVFATARTAPVATSQNLRVGQEQELAVVSLALEWLSTPNVGKPIRVAHCRTIQLEIGDQGPQCVIADECSLSSVGGLVIYWHLAPGWQVAAAEAEHVVITGPAQRSIAIYWRYDNPHHISEETYDFSDCYGSTCAATRLQLHFSSLTSLSGRATLVPYGCLDAR